ncbi:MAG: tRNA guanosine(34) transglycosylase Tgt [Planctomycetota bacterium]
MRASALSYTLLHRSGAARRGRFTTAHGVVETPAFMPVGTQAAVKCATPGSVADTGAQVVLANTYHLGSPERTALIERLGGLHAAMRWERTILTDSGGFQVFSLSDREVDETGVTFRWRSGDETMRLTPESSMEIQRRLGADIVMAFDECVEYPAPRDYVAASVERTQRWLERCAAVALAPHQHLFGIVQGGVELDLRARSAELVASLDLPGTAIGGVSVGEGLELLERVVGHTAPLLPADRPRYLMGVGLPEDLLVSIAAGMDMFDCVIPTRYAREGTVFTWGGKMRLRDKRYRKDRYPIDTHCRCPACAGGFARAYLRHLFFAGEPLAEMLATLHNLTFYQDLMQGARAAIEADRFADWAAAVRARLGGNEGRRRG